MKYKDIKVGQRLVIKNATSCTGDKEEGDIVTVSALGGRYPNDTWVYVEGNDANSGLGSPASAFEPAPEIVALDLTKPLETLDGDPVELITTTARGDYPVLGYIGDRPGVTAWTTEGKLFINSGHPALDLRNVVVKPATLDVTGYVNVFKNEDGTLRAGSVFEKDAPFEHHSAVGRVKVTFTAVEGEFAK